MGAGIRNHSVAVAEQADRPIVFRQAADHVVVFDPRWALRRQEHRQDRRFGRERIQARGGVEHIRVVEEARILRAKFREPGRHGFGERDQLVGQVARGVVGKVAAAMRRADGDNRADRGIGVEIKSAVEGGLCFLVGFHQLNWIVADDVPEIVAAVDDLHVRNQTAHAVADEHHLIERRLLSRRIERISQIGQCFAELGCAAPKRLAGRIQDKTRIDIGFANLGRRANR